MIVSGKIVTFLFSLPFVLVAMLLALNFFVDEIAKALAVANMHIKMPWPMPQWGGVGRRLRDVCVPLGGAARGRARRAALHALHAVARRNLPGSGTARPGPCDCTKVRLPGATMNAK